MNCSTALAKPSSSCEAVTHVASRCPSNERRDRGTEDREQVDQGGIEANAIARVIRQTYGCSRRRLERARREGEEVGAASTRGALQPGVGAPRALTDLGRQALQPRRCSGQSRREGAVDNAVGGDALDAAFPDRGSHGVGERPFADDPESALGERAAQDDFQRIGGSETINRPADDGAGSAASGALATRFRVPPMGGGGSPSPCSRPASASRASSSGGGLRSTQ